MWQSAAHIKARIVEISAETEWIYEVGVSVGSPMAWNMLQSIQSLVDFTDGVWLIRWLDALSYGHVYRMGQFVVSDSRNYIDLMHAKVKMSNSGDHWADRSVLDDAGQSLVLSNTENLLSPEGQKKKIGNGLFISQGIHKQLDTHVGHAMNDIPSIVLQKRLVLSVDGRLPDSAQSRRHCFFVWTRTGEDDCATGATLKEYFSRQEANATYHCV